MAEDFTPDVAAHASHLLPDLEAVAQQLVRDPRGVMRRAFPDTDPGSGSRAIVGPGSGLPPLAVDRVGAALSAERKRLLEVGVEALDTLRLEGPAAVLTPESQLGIEAIVSVARPALMLRDGAFDDAPPPWDDILGPYRDGIRAAAMSVGRIGVPGLPQVPYAGTGFLVAEDAVMTNCHVAMVFSRAGSDGGWSFQSGLEVNLDFVEDPDARHRHVASQRVMRIDGVIGIHPALDLALLRVSPDGAGRRPKPLTVMSHDPEPLAGRNVYLLGYPAPDYRNDVRVQRSIFGDRFFVKRLQPGAAMAPPPGARFRIEPCSMGAELDDVMFHDASTLGGNSGSCVIDLESNHVIGLHFAGEYMRYNEAVALWRLVDDPLLTRAGVNFA
jgi:Trypsin-like peptidase domain